MTAVGLEPSILAHGGLGGTLIEVGLTIGILAVFIAAWTRERRARTNEGERNESAADDQLFRDQDDGPAL